jgi:hypothetical protein
MTRSSALVAVGMFMVALPVWSLDTVYVLKKGSDQLCQAFLERKSDIQYSVPSLRKGDSRWAEYRERCPDFLKKERWMAYRHREFDDYALYSVDVDNDGEADSVLYRRHDKPYFVTHRSPDGSEYRQQDGMEVTEEFFRVELASCKMERVFGGYEKTQLVSLDGVVYIQHLNPRDARKTLAIYKKSKGVTLSGSYQDDICRLQRQ